MPTSNVFISYSHDSVEHEERLLALAERLRSDGVDANSINTAGKAVNPPNVAGVDVLSAWGKPLFLMKMEINSDPPSLATL